VLGGWPRRGRRIAYLACFLFFTVATAALVFNSEPYEFAKRYVSSDPQVTTVTGRQSSVRVSWLRGFRYVFGDHTGEAQFTFVVKGDRGEFEVRVQLEKRGNLWKVLNSEAIAGDGATSRIVASP